MDLVGTLYEKPLAVVAGLWAQITLVLVRPPKSTFLRWYKIREVRWVVKGKINEHCCKTGGAFRRTIFTRVFILIAAAGELAQVVERLLRMREVPGSIPDSPPFFFSFFHICHWWQKTRKPLRNLKEMKLERNVTVFDTYRPFFYWIWRRVSETNMRRTFRQGKQQKTRKLHLILLFFSSVTLIVVFGKIIAIERFPMRHDITGFWWVNALKLSLVV